MSTSDPELISADTLLSKRANVTFFSSLSTMKPLADVDTDAEFSENVVSFMSLSESTGGGLSLFSERCMRSSKDI